MNIKHVIFDGFGTLVERQKPMSFSTYMKCASSVQIDWARAMTAPFSWIDWAQSIGHSAQFDDDLGSIILYQDIPVTLHSLTKAGVEFSVMSNLASCYGPPLQKALSIFPVKNWFLSYADGMKKPDALYYQHALKTLGLPGRHVLFVGDHAKHDVLGPSLVGMNALRVRRDALSMNRMLEPWC